MWYGLCTEISITEEFKSCLFTLATLIELLSFIFAMRDVFDVSVGV